MTAFVTGAGAGIGAAIARALSAQGYAVAVGDIDEDAAHAVAADLHRAIAVPLDVTDQRSIESACDAALAALGPLKAWISNAGISSMARFTDVREEELDRILAVNVKAAFLCGQVAARRFITQGGGGVIVNTASMAGKQGGVPFLAPYVASKFAVVGLTQAMAYELAEHGIRVNCVCPGYVSTGMQERELVWEAELRSTSVEAVRDLYLAATPLGRLELPEDVAAAVAFLVSENEGSVNEEVQETTFTWQVENKGPRLREPFFRRSPTAPHSSHVVKVATVTLLRLCPTPGSPSAARDGTTTEGISLLIG